MSANSKESGMDTEKERPLTDRESAVLNAIIYEYIVTGKPVGSRSFVQKYSFSLSPATMRNIMYDLEKMGYLMQPHTSSGRVPTDRGYRYYVDSLLSSYDFNSEHEIDEKIFSRELQLDKIFDSVARMLSSISNYAGIMLSPRPDFTVVKVIELIPLESDEVLMLAITRTGMTITRKVTLSERVTQDDLFQCSRFLTSELGGYSVEEIKESIFLKLRTEKSSSLRNDVALDIAQLALNESNDSSISIEGIENLLRIPEMVETERLNSLLKIIEEKTILKGLLEGQLENEGVNILIGNEIENPEIKGCSIVSSSYKIGNRPVGAVGVFGPTRMDYEKILPLVDYTGKAVSGLLTKLSR